MSLFAWADILGKLANSISAYTWWRLQGPLRCQSEKLGHDPLTAQGKLDAIKNHL